VLARGLAHAGMLRGVGEDASYGGGEIFVAGDAAGFSFADDRGRTAVGSDYGGNTRSQGFKDHVAEGVGVRGKDEEVHIGIGTGKRIAAQDTGKLRSGQMLAQPTLFGPLPDDEKATMSNASRGELLLDPREECDILLNGQAADKAKHEGVVPRLALAVRRREELRIDAALHQSTGTRSFLFKQTTEAGIRRKENASE